MKVAEGAIDSQDITQALQEIQGEGTIHRMILGVNGKHYITIRKTSGDKWRVIDSMQNAHKPEASTKVEQIQPSFGSLGAAVGHAVDSHNRALNGGNIQVIYASKDTAPSSIIRTVGKVVLVSAVAVGIALVKNYCF